MVLVLNNYGKINIYIYLRNGKRPKSRICNREPLLFFLIKSKKTDNIVIEILVESINSRSASEYIQGKVRIDLCKDWGIICKDFKTSGIGITNVSCGQNFINCSIDKILSVKRKKRKFVIRKLETVFHNKDTYATYLD